MSFRSENLVGNVISGKKLNPVMVSYNSLEYSLSLILSKFILKSLVIITSEFLQSSCNNNNNDNSSIHCLRVTFRYRGGLYILPTITGFLILN